VVNQMKSTFLLSLTIFAVACGTARAGNLVANGSFEEGTLGIGGFEDWQTNLGDINTFVDSDGVTRTSYGDATAGLWSAFFGSTAADGGASISQNLATTPGQTYLLSFDLANDNADMTPINDFVVSVEGVPVFTFSDLGDQNYVHEQFAFVASGSSTSLQFNGSNDQSYFDLDNVVVAAAAPEPSGFALMGCGLFLLYAGLGRHVIAAR
jgi:hypothetical protein